MLKRTITTIVIILVFIPLSLLSHTSVLPIVFAILSFLATYEVLGCIGVRKNWAVAVPSYAVSVFCPLSVRFLSDSFGSITYCFAVFFFFLFYLLAVSVFSKGQTTLAVVVSVFSICMYTTSGFTLMISMRDTQHGFHMFLLTLFLPWITDVFAYLSGRVFGKHKLIPEISPNKTVEGSVGGIVFSVLTVLLYGKVVSLISPEIPSYPALAMTGFFISIVSQIGDLIMSSIKRYYHVKDFGWIFPGHGGILDRFDSVLGVVPFAYAASVIPALFSLFS